MLKCLAQSQVNTTPCKVWPKNTYTGTAINYEKQYEVDHYLQTADTFSIVCGQLRNTKNDFPPSIRCHLRFPISCASGSLMSYKGCQQLTMNSSQDSSYLDHIRKFKASVVVVPHLQKTAIFQFSLCVYIQETEEVVP